MKLRILVAEPDSFLAAVYSEKLAQCGYEITICRSELECISKYHHKLKESFSANPDPHNPFGIVLVSESLGTKNGIPIIDEISYLNPKQKILLISGYQKTMPQNPSIEIIEKPFSIPFLISRLKQISHKPTHKPYLNN